MGLSSDTAQMFHVKHLCLDETGIVTPCHKLGNRPCGECRIILRVLYGEQGLRGTPLTPHGILRLRACSAALRMTTGAERVKSPVPLTHAPSLGEPYGLHTEQAP